MSTTPSIDLHGDSISGGAEIRLGTSRLRHVTVGNGYIGYLQFSPCGRWLVSAAREGGSVCHWDASNGRLINQWSNDDQGELRHVEFSPDSRWVIAFPYGRPWRESVRGWEVDSGNEVSWEALQSAETLTFTGSGDLVAFGHQRRVSVCAVSTQKLMAEWQIPEVDEGTLNGLLFLDKDHVCGNTRHCLYIWDLLGASVGQWRFESTEKIAVSPDEQWLAVVAWGKPYSSPESKLKRASRGKTLWLHLLHISSRRWRSRVFPCSKFGISDVVFSQDGRFVVFAGQSKGSKGLNTTSLFRLSVNAKRTLHAWEDILDFQQQFCIASDSQHGILLSGSASSGGGHGVCWSDLQNKHVIHELQPPSALQRIALSRDDRLIAAASRDGFLSVYEISRDHQATSIRPTNTLLVRHESEVTAIALNQDGSQAVTAAEEIIFWDTETGRPITNPVRLADGRASEIAISRDGQRAAISYWNVEASCGQIAMLSRNGTGPNWSAAGPDLAEMRFFDDDNLLVVVDRQQDVLLKYDQETGEIRDRVAYGGADSSGYEYCGLPLHHDQSWSACVKVDHLLIHTESGNQIQQLPFPTTVDGNSAWLISMKRSHTGDQVGVILVFDFNAGDDGNQYRCAALVWDIADSQPCAALYFITERLDNPTRYPVMAFSDDGSCRIGLLESSWNPSRSDPYASLRVWDVFTGSLLLNISEVDKRETNSPCYNSLIRFSPDGRILACGIGNRTLLWRLNS